MSREMIKVRLDLIAAKSKILAEQAKTGSYWANDLRNGISEIRNELDNLEQDMRGMDASDR